MSHVNSHSHIFVYHLRSFYSRNGTQESLFQYTGIFIGDLFEKRSQANRFQFSAAHGKGIACVALLVYPSSSSCCCLFSLERERVDHRCCHSLVFEETVWKTGPRSSARYDSTQCLHREPIPSELTLIQIRFLNTIHRQSAVRTPHDTTKPYNLFNGQRECDRSFGISLASNDCSNKPPTANHKKNE